MRNKDKYNRYFCTFIITVSLLHGRLSNGQRVSKYEIPVTRYDFSEFTRRLQTSNMYVVKHALFDLSNYFEKYQINCQKDLFKDPGLTPAITSLVRTILDTAAKFKIKTQLFPLHVPKLWQLLEL